MKFTASSGFKEIFTGQQPSFTAFNEVLKPQLARIKQVL
jgi:hypothetical protein